MNIVGDLGSKSSEMICSVINREAWYGTTFNGYSMVSTIIDPWTHEAEINRGLNTVD